MENFKSNIKPLTMAVGACLALSAAATLWAQTDVMVANDGQALTAIVSSSEEVLSTSIRIVGPNHFVFEKRVEGDAIDWIPESGLEDGVYQWEAWTVTARSGAEVRDLIGDMQRRGLDEDTIQHRIENIPLERFFNSNDKNVQTESGAFRVHQGQLHEMDTSEATSAIQKPNRLQQLATRLIDGLFPSAHAQEASFANTSFDVRNPVSIACPFVRIYAEGTENSNRVLMRNCGGDLDFRHQGRATMRIRADGNVGIGSIAPTVNLHIRDSSRPQIRLEDSGESQSWYIKAGNQGAFEIGESQLVTENNFSRTAFRIYPDTPEGAMQIDRFQSCQFTFPGQPPSCGVERGRVGLNTMPSADLHIKSTVGPPFGSFPNHSSATLRLESSSGAAMTVSGGGSLLVTSVGGNANIFGVNGSAPSNSLRIASNGNVGFGTNSPNAPIHVRRDDGTAEILVEETEFAEVNQQFVMKQNGNTGFRLVNTSNDRQWQFRTGGQGGTSSVFLINLVEQEGPEFRLDAAGNLFLKGTVSNRSSREMKTNIRNIDTEQAIQNLKNLNLHEWAYTDSPEKLHVGPMAEDFNRLFGYGGNPESIAPADLASLALVAAQELLRTNHDLEQRIKGLESRMSQ